MRLVALPLQQPKRRRGVRQHDGLRRVRQVQLLIALRQREKPHVVLQPHLLQHAKRGRELRLAAVDEHDARRRRAAGEPRAQRLGDCARVVGRSDAPHRAAAVLLEGRHAPTQRRVRAHGV